MDMNNFFSRTELLIGRDALEKLKGSTVTIFGIGGVGSHATEALARCGVGNLVLIDGDIIRPSNINRQVHATVDTIGMPKVEVMRERLLRINPEINVMVYQEFILPENAGRYISPNTCYVVDAVDTVSAKIAIVQISFIKKIPVISSMGAGNKLDPTRFKVADIYETSVDPLARVVRKELKKRGIPSLKVVYSDEKPVCNHKPPASTSFVPPVAGLIIAGEVIRDLIR
jgi:tRNA A37 threonylcarbamoyladenosine dehydratase